MLIAQITDIHAAPDNDHLQRLEQVLSWLEQMGPDIMVLSGDLTDGGWDEGYLRIAAQLEEQDYPTLILPGNSDDRGCMLNSGVTNAGCLTHRESCCTSVTTQAEYVWREWTQPSASTATEQFRDVWDDWKSNLARLMSLRFCCFFTITFILPGYSLLMKQYAGD